MTLESVAIATMIEDSHLECRPWTMFESIPALLRGSRAQTSPREPENKQRVSTPLKPNVRLKPSSKTEPPLSQRRAKVGKSVNYSSKNNLLIRHFLI